MLELFEEIQPPFRSISGVPPHPSKNTLRELRSILRGLRGSLLELLKGGEVLRFPLEGLGPELENCLIGTLGRGHTIACVPGSPTLAAASTHFPGVWLVARRERSNAPWQQWIEVSSAPAFLDPHAPQHPVREWKSNLPKERHSWLCNLLDLLTEKLCLCHGPSLPSRQELSPWILSEKDFQWLEEVLGKGPVATRTELVWDQVYHFSSHWPYVWWVLRLGRSGTVREEAFEVARTPTLITPTPFRIAKAAEDLDRLIQSLLSGNRR
jgi:hypothetical protein